MCFGLVSSPVSPSVCHCTAAAFRAKAGPCLRSGVCQVSLKGLIDTHTGLSSGILRHLTIVSKRNDDERIAAAIVELSDKLTIDCSLHHAVEGMKVFWRDLLSIVI